jgi:hypothetical protein
MKMFRKKGSSSLPPTIAEKNKAKSDSYFSMPKEQRASLHRMGNAPQYSDPNPPAAPTGATGWKTPFSENNRQYISQQQFASKPQKWGGL